MLTVARKRNVFLYWLRWHYAFAFRKITQNWHNLLRFNLDYFSVLFLFRTLFAPWRRYYISYGKSFSIKHYAEALALNAFSRLIGMIIRMVLIVLGVLMEVVIFVGGLFLVLFWLLMPFIIIFGLFFSIKWLFTLI